MWGEYHFAGQETIHNDFQKHADKLKSLIQEDERILDIGCGDGYLTWYLKCEKGIDSCETGIHYAKKRKLPCEIGTIYGLEKHGKFDAVLVADVLDWCNDVDTAIKEIGKITNKAYISVHTEDEMMLANTWQENELIDLFANYGWTCSHSEIERDRVYAVFNK